ncbi:hypothetical protein WT27_13285 [Burkholderia territorii]|uniref:Uncharacterized protein n=1 Tax=Burkholderia territorii TaxID=1503055 RepID=A0A106DR49_9BURK|nr:hypothetical protein [Burkholderia territorii]KVV40895.1 hypothetical protein WT27_13285 [Burkholderia territorii]KVX33842.1 hypothetical protein WT31_09185 [Burkholderia territorii]
MSTTDNRAHDALTRGQRDTLELAIGYIASSERNDRHEHIARIRAILSAFPGEYLEAGQSGSACDPADVCAGCRCGYGTSYRAPDEPVSAPIPMLLFCPKCGEQHIDAPEPADADIDVDGTVISATSEWTNPPHRSHLCHACGIVWRPADVATVGVATIATRGTADTWTVEQGSIAEIDLSVTGRRDDAYTSVEGDAS